MRHSGQLFLSWQGEREKSFQMEISDNNVQLMYISQDNTNLHRDAMKERKKERGKEKRSVLDRGKFSSLIFCLKREKTTHDPRLWMPKIHGNKCNIVTWNKREDYMCVWEKIRFTFRFLRSFCSLCFFLSHWRLQRERKACVIYFFSCIISFYFL